MKKPLPALLLAGTSLFSVHSQAAVFTPTFDTPSFPGTQFDVDAAHNDYYAENFGITVENAYLYVDSRDTFDGVGIANGLVANIGTPQAGKVNFLDTTDFVSLEYLALQTSTYSAYSASGSLLSTSTVDDGTGTLTLGGGIISYILFSGRGGFTTISGLTYNYDGTTDGRNTDLNPVPLPAAAWLFGSALAGAGVIGKRKKQAA